jgi:hypothetical protein
LSNGSRAAHMAADEGAVDGEGGGVASWLRPEDPPDDSVFAAVLPQSAALAAALPPAASVLPAPVQESAAPPLDMALQQVDRAGSVPSLPPLTVSALVW